MPAKPSKICSKPGCSNLTKEKYCEKHRDLLGKEKAERNRFYDDNKRNQVSKRFYNSKEWIILRDHKRRLSPYCEMCYVDDGIVKPVDVIDHIVELNDEGGWELRLTLSNLQSLCHAHHNAKTAKRRKERYRG